LNLVGNALVVILQQFFCKKRGYLALRKES